MKRRGVITTVRAPPLLAYQILLHTAQAFSADVLLVMGMSEELQAFASGDSLLTLEGKRELPRRSKRILAAGIMGVSVGAASIGLLPIAISALAGAIAMFLTGCVKFDRKEQLWERKLEWLCCGLAAHSHFAAAHFAGDHRMRGPA